MRQGLGLVVSAALVAGLLPVVLHTIGALQMGTVVPLAELAARAEAQLARGAIERWEPLAVLLGTGPMLAGLAPAIFPSWLAALLSGLGEWINWPLRWLAWWIVYGAGVMAVAKLLGARVTLQQFYAMTSFAALPLILTGLGPIPCLGQVAVLVSLIATLVVYVAAVRAATELGWGQALLSVLLPGGVAALVGLMALGSVVASLARFWM
jgi:hypothetical protein